MEIMKGNAAVIKILPKLGKKESVAKAIKNAANVARVKRVKNLVSLSTKDILFSTKKKETNVATNNTSPMIPF